MDCSLQGPSVRGIFQARVLEWIAISFSIKEIKPEYSLEGLMLKLKHQYFGHLMQRTDSLEKKKKNTDAGKDRKQEEKGTAEDEMVEYHHQLNGHEFEQTPGDSRGQRTLACYRP